MAMALVYQTLSNRQPELDNGVFAYARALGGSFRASGLDHYQQFVVG